MTSLEYPSSQFDFTALRDRMAAFTTLFDNHLDTSRKSVLADRHTFRAQLNELHEDHKSTAQKIDQLQTLLATNLQLQTRETAEKTEIKNQIVRLERHGETQQRTRDELAAAITAVRRQVAARETAQREFAHETDRQRRLDGPELGAWERVLACRLEAEREGVVKVQYSFDEGGAEFELSVPEDGEGYHVVSVRPRLERAEVDRVLAKLGQTKEIAVLLKGMRELFARELGHGQKMVQR